VIDEKVEQEDYYLHSVSHAVSSHHVISSLTWEQANCKIAWKCWVISFNSVTESLSIITTKWVRKFAITSSSSFTMTWSWKSWLSFSNAMMSSSISSWSCTSSASICDKTAAWNNKSSVTSFTSINSLKSSSLVSLSRTASTRNCRCCRTASIRSLILLLMTSRCWISWAWWNWCNCLNQWALKRIRSCLFWWMKVRRIRMLMRKHQWWEIVSWEWKRC